MRVSLAWSNIACMTSSSIYHAKKSEFARAAGISGATATNLFKPGHMLADALVGNLVDMGHPDVIAYLEQRRDLPKGARVGRKSKKPCGYKNTRARQYVGAEPKEAPPPEPKPEEAPPPKSETPTQTQGDISYDVKDYEHLTVREVVMRFGHIDAFKRFVESAKQVADYKLKEISIQKTRGELVDREEVRRRVFQLLDVAFTRLVSDVPTSLSKQILAVAQTGGNDALQDIERMIRDANSQVLQNCKHTVKRARITKDERPGR